MARLDADLDNFRAAHDWALATGDAAGAGAIAGGLYYYWWVRGLAAEGLERMQRSVDMGAVPLEVQAQLVRGLAQLTAQAGSPDDALPIGRAAVDIAKATDNPALFASTLAMLGRLLLDVGDDAAAVELGDAAAQAAAGARSVEAFSRFISMDGRMKLGDYERAAADDERARQLFDAKGDAFFSAWLRVIRAEHLWNRDRTEDVESSLEAALDSLRELQASGEELVTTLAILSRVRCHRGDTDGALAALAEAATGADRFVGAMALGVTAAAVAETAVALDRPDVARRALGRYRAARRRTRRGGEQWVEDLEGELGDELDDDGVPLAALVAQLASGVPPRTSDASVVVLRRSGDVWEVGHPGATFRLPDRKGMRGLAVLLAQPGVEVHALELAADIDRTGAPVAGAGGAGPVLDATAKAAYRTRLVDLQAEIDEAHVNNDRARAERATWELDALTDQLATAIGLGGRDRQHGAPAERARINVTRVVRDAIGRIAEHDVDLGHHLRTCVRTGVFCSYQPPPSGGPRWEL